MATDVPPTPHQESQPSATPPLQNGDRLTRDEFERRYRAMPRLKKAELLEGVVYMPSPVRHRRHGKPHFNLIGWLARYVAATPGIEGGDNTTLRLDLDNEPQPDAFLIVLPECGGQVTIAEDDYVVGGPEWVGEVAASSVGHDLHVKMHVYRRNGVREYFVWRVDDRAIDWFALRSGQYERLPLEDGIYRSEVMPGLWLAAQALLDADFAEVARVLDLGLQTNAHAEFVARLARPRGAL